MRPIDADKLIEEYKRLLQRFEEMGDDSAVTAVELCRHKAECVAPILDVMPVVHGEWIRGDKLAWQLEHYICSICSEISWGKKRNYCPNCGAKMDLR